MLTIHLQPRHARPIDQSAIRLLHFQGLKGLGPGQIRPPEVPLAELLWVGVGKESIVDCYDVWRKTADHSTENLPGIIPEVALRGYGLDRLVR